MKHRNRHVQKRREQGRPHALVMVLGKKLMSGGLKDRDRNYRRRAGDSHRKVSGNHGKAELQKQSQPMSQLALDQP